MGRGQRAAEPRASAAAGHTGAAPGLINGEEYIHIAPQGLRDQIRTQGLLPGTHVWESSDCADEFHCEMEGNTARGPGSWYEPHDVWLVVIDPRWRKRHDQNYNHEAGAWIVQRAIPPHALTLDTEQPWFRSDENHLRSLAACDECERPKPVGALYCGGGECLLALDAD
jgi:hypothetical protein